MVLLKATALAATLLATSSSFTVLGASISNIQINAASPNFTLDSNAPAAKDLRGVHLLLENDVDNLTPKFPVIMLSMPRSNNDSQVACVSLGENLVAATTGNLTSLLMTTPVAQTELQAVTRLWVSNGNSTTINGTNGTNGRSTCTAFDKRTGQTVQINCSTKLPSLCTNSQPPYFNKLADKSKQIKVDTPGSDGETWQGYRDQNQFRFLGIPFAQPPVGNLRFMAPKPLKKTASASANNGTNSNISRTVNDATSFGNICSQFYYDYPQLNQAAEVLVMGAVESEDCLYLNVHTPSLKAENVKGLPVMVYVHGGSFITYSGSTTTYEPGNLVSRGGVVVVSLNYRLSIFGLFEAAPAIPRSIAPGNLAIHDQIAALQWVRDNIRAFGGDPNQVTIWGQSAGGHSMRALLSAPSAFGLYHNVISQSDLLGVPFSSTNFSSNLGSLILKNLNCTSAEDLLACAQNKTVDEIQAAQLQAMGTVVSTPEYDWIRVDDIYRPTVDGDFIPEDFAELVRKGTYNTKANILWGTTHDEAGDTIPDFLPEPVPIANATEALMTVSRDNRTYTMLQSPFYALNASDPDTVRGELSNALTDYYFGCALQVMSRGIALYNNHATNPSRLYVYKMDYGRNVNDAFGGNVSDLCLHRVCHSDDIVPSFGSGDVRNGFNQTGDNARFSRQVIDRFSMFAKSGNPNPSKKAQLAQGLAALNPDVTGVQWPTYTAENPVFLFALANSSVAVNADTPRCNWLAENIHYNYQVHGPSGTFVPIYPPMNN